MTRHEVTLEHIKTISRMAALVDIEDVRALSNELGRYDAVMPIVDPTGWISTRETKPDWDKLVSAFLKFREVLEGYKESNS